MRIAIVSDIHGNLVALDAVLASLERERVDQVVCLGDVVANGPQPAEVLRKVRDLRWQVVKGNTDDWFLFPPPFDLNAERERRLKDIWGWTQEQLTPSDLDYIRSFPPRIELALVGGRNLLCYHGSPQSNTDLIWAATPDDDLARMLAGYRASLMAGGHTHEPMLRRFQKVLVMNPGSVGMPFERGNTPAESRRPPWAEYAIVETLDGELSVTFKRAPVDVQAVVQGARRSGIPQLDWWISEWVQ
ncbi:MAG TPA: metallophosphoesterase family protein [Anaerolineae bacterium]